MDQKVASYRYMYENVKDIALDDRYLRTSACLLSLSGTNKEKFTLVADLIYDKVNLFTKLKSPTRYLIAILLTVRFNDPEVKVAELLSLYEIMREKRFQPGTFTFLAATIVLMNEDKQNEQDLLISTKEVYERMESIHPFLTTTYSYPLATLLAGKENNERIEKSDRLYKLLNLNGFRKGRDLQLLTHILLLHGEEDIKELAIRAVTILKKFDKFHMSKSKVIYPLIGLLSFVPLDQLEIDKLVLTFERLNKEKLFRGYRAINMIVVVSLLVSEHINNEILAPIVLTTVEKLILNGESFNPIHPRNFLPGLLK